MLFHEKNLTFSVEKAEKQNGKNFKVPHNFANEAKNYL